MPKAKKHSEYIEEVRKINPHITLKGEYKTALSRFECTCSLCGYKWITDARNLLTPKKCLGCLTKERTFVYPDISDKEFKEQVYKNYPNLIITSTYTKDMKLVRCKCNDCGYISRVRVQKLLENTYKCTICVNGKENIIYGKNDIKSCNPIMYDCLYSKKDADKYTINSKTKVDFICPSCGNILKNKSIDKVHTRGLKCKCQDGNSLGEKYFFHMLCQVSDNFKVETKLNNNQKYRYDFQGEINNNKWIVEIMGKQHYYKSFETCGGRSLDEEIQNDINKKNYALENGINTYIAIDSKNSGFLELKNEILNSEFSTIYDLSNVDWELAYKNSLTSDMKIIVALWNEGYKVMQICDKLEFSKNKVRHLLKNANDLNLCKYNHKKSNKISVKCIDTNEVFDNLREAEIKYNIHRGYLSGYLKNNKNISKELVNNFEWKYIIN